VAVPLGWGRHRLLACRAAKNVKRGFFRVKSIAIFWKCIHEIRNETFAASIALSGSGVQRMITLYLVVFCALICYHDSGMIWHAYEFRRDAK